ncbi:MAG TPA: BatD family protein [Bacteroidia bacterium]|nr:protein BatD [Bacteroidia bacterium]QQR94579.1 MAG: protein BatD [Bacteroidota bacterium]MBP7714152.1 protein BatD [Bacteroidia bacterium]MBP8668806.1 protein BatD [Bacteroidia bacterium]HOZ82584.1 BatD family protein [Bacteroidia bacterium]
MVETKAIKIKHKSLFAGLVLLLLFFTTNIFAAEITFIASVNKNPVGTNEQFSITYTLNTQGSNFQAPTFRDFNVLSGPNQSTSMQFINGNMSQSVSFTYYLTANSEGTFRIDPATITVNGGKVKSNTLTINVVKSQKAQSGAQQQKSNDADAGISSNSVFLRVSVNKSSVYRGEALLATYKLYTKVNLVNYSIDKLPALNGFWSQELKMPQQLELTTENYNGEMYRVGIVKKVLLFPQQSGTLTIEPMEGSCIARIQTQRKRSNNPFDIFNDPFFNDPFFGSAQDVKVNVKSLPVKITVKDLPQENDNAFKGAIGSFSLQATTDNDKVKANDAINLKIKISGKGNLKLIDAPEVEVPTDFEKYDPKVSDNTNISESGVSGSKTFEYLLIPRHEGEYTIDPIKFTYFDLDKKQYEQLQSSAFKITVKGISGDASAAQSVATSQNKTDIKLLGKDISFIKTGKLTTKPATTFYLSGLYYLLVAIPFAALILLILYIRKRNRLAGDAEYMRSSRATKMAHKRLSIAKKMIDAKKDDAFYEEISKAIYGYASDKLNINFSEMTKENLRQKLINRNIPDALTERIIATIDLCELARYAPLTQNNNTQSIYTEAAAIITELENYLNK